MTLQEYKGAVLPQQADFAEKYVTNGYNGTLAAIAAKYSKNSAHTQAVRLLKDANVKAYIEALDKEKYRGFEFDLETIKKRLEWLNNSDILDYVTFDGKTVKFKPFDQLTEAQRYAIKGIKKGKYGIELTLHDKAWNAEMINRIVGSYKKDNEQKVQDFTGVAVLLPDNGRGKIVPLETQEPTT